MNSKNRIRTNQDCAYLFCTKLAYRTELKTLETLQSLNGGTYSPGQDPTQDLEPNIGGGGGGWRPSEVVQVSVGIAGVAAAAGEEIYEAAKWSKEKVGEAIDTSVYWIDAVVDSHSRFFRDITGLGF